MRLGGRAAEIVVLAEPVDWLSERPRGEDTQRSIDQEVARLLRDAEDTATKLLRDHRQTLDRVIDLLLERETTDGADLAAIVGAPEPADHEPAGAPLALTMTAIPGGQRRDQHGKHDR